MTTEDWDAVARQVDQKLERAAERLDEFTGKVQEADQRHRVRHDKGMTELAEIRKLPPVARFKAEMRFRP